MEHCFSAILRIVSFNAHSCIHPSCGYTKFSNYFLCNIINVCYVHEWLVFLLRWKIEIIQVPNKRSECRQCARFKAFTGSDMTGYDRRTLYGRRADNGQHKCHKHVAPGTSHTVLDCDSESFTFQSAAELRPDSFSRTRHKHKSDKTEIVSRRVCALHCAHR